MGTATAALFGYQVTVFNKAVNRDTSCARCATRSLNAPRSWSPPSTATAPLVEVVIANIAGATRRTSLLRPGAHGEPRATGGIRGRPLYELPHFKEGLLLAPLAPRSPPVQIITITRAPVQERWGCRRGITATTLRVPHRGASRFPGCGRDQPAACPYAPRNVRIYLRTTSPPAPGWATPPGADLLLLRAFTSPRPMRVPMARYAPCSQTSSGRRVPCPGPSCR